MGKLRPTTWGPCTHVLEFGIDSTVNRDPLELPTGSWVVFAKQEESLKLLMIHLKTAINSNLKQTDNPKARIQVRLPLRAQRVPRLQTEAQVTQR